MKILHIFSTFAVGGPQVRTADLINRLPLHWEHDVLAMDGCMDASTLIGENAQFNPLSLPIQKGRGVSLKNLWNLRRLNRERSPDLLLTYNFGALEAAFANRFWPLCRHIHVEDGFGPEEADGRQLPRRVWFRRVALTHAGTTILVPSLTLQRIALEQWRFKPGAGALHSKWY